MAKKNDTTNLTELLLRCMGEADPKKYRVHACKVNEAPVANLLDQKFSDRLPGACVVSALTYVRVGTQWAYICILLDLGTR